MKMLFCIFSWNQNDVILNILYIYNYLTLSIFPLTLTHSSLSPLAATASRVINETSWAEVELFWTYSNFLCSNSTRELENFWNLCSRLGSLRVFKVWTRLQLVTYFWNERVRAWFFFGHFQTNITSILSFNHSISSQLRRCNLCKYSMTETLKHWLSTSIMLQNTNYQTYDLKLTT